MNLQDKNLHSKNIKKQARMLRSLGVQGLFIPENKKSKLLNTINHNSLENKDQNIKVLFIGDDISQENSEEGVLFINIITKGMKLSKDDIHTIDTKEMILTHKGLSQILLEGIHQFKPFVVIALGEKISQILLNSNNSILELRNSFVNFYGTKLMCTLGLRRLIEDSSKKKLVWEDIQKVNNEVSSEK